MRGMLVFDHLNDIVYVKCCYEFIQHVAKLARTQGLVTSEHATLFGTGKRAIDPNILIQLFSPLVTSQRFMKEQFGNPYASVQCEDGTNIVFHEYMGFLFLRVGTEDIPYLKRVVGVCISLVSYICGPDVGLLKSSPRHAQELDSLLNTWAALHSCDQTFLIEALEQMAMNPQKSTAMIKALQQIASKVQIQNEHVHALLFSETKLLSWYCSKGAFQMTPEDILVLMILCQRTWLGPNLRGLFKKRMNYVKLGEAAPVKTVSSSSETESEESDWTSTGFSSSSRENLFDEFEYLEDLSEEFHDENARKHSEETMKNFVILLKNGVQFVPHRVHIGSVQDGIYLVLLLEPPTTQLITSMCTSIQMGVDFHAARRDVARDKQYVELIENIIKKNLDFLKKQKNMSLRSDLSSRWDTFKMGFQTYLKTKVPLSVQISPVVDTLIIILRGYANEQQILFENPKILSTLTPVWRKIRANAEPAWSCLRISSTRELSLGARQTLSMSKYLEDFPGLVHFIYIDRSKHSVIFPPLDFNGDDAIKLTKRKIWAMVKFAREHMQQGHFSLMWKDSAFNFAYFLWFEDLAGTSIRVKNQPSLPWDAYPLPALPGILCGDFYKRLVNECFPGSTAPKVRCLELFCIHLGLVTSSVVLQHCKRLATTINDVTGTANPVDLL